MRHSVDDLAPGQTYTVLLYGENVSNRCVGFDTVEQWVDCFKLDDRGTILIDATYNTVTERLYGDVVVYEDSREESEDENSKKAHSHWIKEYFKAKRYFRMVKAIK